MYEFVECRKDLPKPSPLPSEYFRHFKDSGVIRIKTGKMDFSIIEKNPTFMVLIKGNVVLQSIRLAAAFFGERGQFISEEISVEDQKIILKKSVTHGYYHAILEDKTTGVNGWKEFPRDDRVMNELKTMNYLVVIILGPERIRMDIEISGADDVTVSCEMSFRAEDALSGTISELDTDDRYFLQERYAEFQNHADILKFGPVKWSTDGLKYEECYPSNKKNRSIYHKCPPLFIRFNFHEETIHPGLKFLRIMEFMLSSW